MNIALFGYNGFIGQNLIKLSAHFNLISLRKDDWDKNLCVNDVFINLVGKAHDHEGNATEEDYYFANLELTKRIYSEFIKGNGKLFIQISSIAAVEEFESDEPLTEEAKCHPVSWYGKSKRAAELWLLSQEIPENKKLIILRPPMVHGPGDKGNLGILYKFISKGLPYPFASFKNSRSFISINNFVYYIEKILDSYCNLNSGIYHISDTESISTQEIIEVIKLVTTKRVVNIILPNSFIRFIANVGDIIPLPINNKRLKKMTSSLLVSNSKINLNLKIDNLPETGIEGIHKTISWLKNNH